MTKTNAERQREFRERRKAEGWKRLTVMLEPEIVERLDYCRRAAGTPDGRYQPTREAIIRSAINVYWARLSDNADSTLAKK